MYKNEKFSFKTINLIWIGSLDARKSLNILLEVLPVKTTTKYPLKKRKLLFLNWSNL